MTRPWLPTGTRLAGLAWAAGAALRAGGLPERALHFIGGLGDDLMCTAVARELRRRGSGKIWLLTRYQELFAGNPDLVAVPDDFRLRRLCEMTRVPFQRLEYSHPPPLHLIGTLCRAAGVRGEVTLRPHVTLTEPERRAGLVTTGRQVAIQSASLAGARYPILNKQWYPERFQRVVTALRGEFDFVQLGSAADPPLEGCLDLRGRTSVRQTAAILAASRLFVGLESGLMHLARAVECRSVIVYGGWELASETGYSANANLTWEGPCAPCWQRDACDFGRRCMEAIDAATVIAAVRQLDRLHGTALEVDTIVV